MGEVEIRVEIEEQSSSSKKNENTKSKASIEKLENKNSITVDSCVKESKKTDRGRGIKTEKSKQLSDKKGQTRDKGNDMKGKRTVTSNTDQPNNLLKEKKNQTKKKKRGEGKKKKKKKKKK